jgi:cytidylate kinase
LKKRDRQDSTRAYMPLRQADDAMLIDTTALDVEQTIEMVINAVKEKEAR